MPLYQYTNVTMDQCSNSQYLMDHCNKSVFFDTYSLNKKIRVLAHTTKLTN